MQVSQPGAGPKASGHPPLLSRPQVGSCWDFEQLGHDGAPLRCQHLQAEDYLVEAVAAAPSSGFLKRFIYLKIRVETIGGKIARQELVVERVTEKG